MKIDFDWNVIVYFAAISIGVYTALLLFFSARNKTANHLLGFLILSITGWLLDAFFRSSGIYGQNPRLYFLPIYYSFAFGPLIYFYVQAITNEHFILKKSDYVHFLPVAIQILFYLIVALQTYQVKYFIWFHIHQPYTYRIEYDGTWVSLVIYLVLATRYFFQYRSWLANNYSEFSEKQLTWLKLSLMALILVCISWLFEAILRDFSNTYYKYDISTGLLCFIVYCIGFLGTQQSSVNVGFSSDAESEPQATIPVIDNHIVELIGQAMATDRLYLNPELTLAELSGHLRLPAKTVSYHINTAFGKPFNTYVNTFRVEEIKQRLQNTDLEKFTLLSIALDSGFNSKTSFNRIFKEFTGSSPSDFIKR